MNQSLGIACRIAASLAFMLMASLIKFVDELSTATTLFARSIVPVVVLFCIFLLRGRLRDLATPRPGQHAIRALYGGLALFTWFAALKFLPLPDVQALLYLTPMTSVLLAWLILGEKAGLWRMVALVVGLIGMGVIISPQLGGQDLDSRVWLGILLCIGNVLAFSMSVITIRQLSRTEGTMVIVFYYSLFISLFMLPLLPFGWQMPDAEQLLILCGIGVLGGIGQYLMTTSYSLASVSVLAPFEYVSLIWAMILGAVLFDENASATTLAGAGLIIGGGLLVLYRERLTNRRLLTQAPKDVEP